MIQKLAGYFFLFVTLLGVSAIPASAAEKYTIGLIASLTGAAGEQGQNWVDGAMLAKKELEQQGITVDVAIEDDATNPAQAVTAFQKFANVNSVQAVIGGTWDYLAEPLYGLAAQYKIPFLTPTNPVEVVPEKQRSNQYIFVPGLSIAAMHDAFTKFVDEKKIKTLALIYPQVPFGEMQAAAAKEVAREKNITVVSDSAFPPAEYLDILKTDALKIKSTAPDLLYIVTNYSGLDQFTRELKKVGSNPAILTSQHLEHAFEFSRDPSRYANAFGLYPSSVLNSAFAKSFEATYHHAPRVYAAEGYDALKFFVQAKQQHVDVTQPTAHFQYQGVSGTYVLPCPAGSRSPVKTEAVVMTTQNGKFELFE